MALTIYTAGATSTCTVEITFQVRQFPGFKTVKTTVTIPTGCSTTSVDAPADSTSYTDIITAVGPAARPWRDMTIFDNIDGRQLESGGGDYAVGQPLLNPNTRGLASKNSWNIYDQSCGGPPTCPTGSHWDASQSKCVPDIITPPKPPPPPPAGTGFPTPPTSINPTDWIHWIGDVLKWMVDNIWASLSASLLGIFTTIWNLLPDSAKYGVTQFINFWGGIITIFNDPSAFTKQVAAAFPTIELKPLGGGPFTDWVSNILTEIVTEFRPKLYALLDKPPTDPTTLESELLTFRIDVTSRVLGLAIATQLLPFENLSAINAIVSEALDIMGFDALSRLYVERFAEKGIDITLDHAANRHFQRNHPDVGTFLALRAKGGIQQEEYESELAEDAGFSQKFAGYLLDAARAPPSLEDYITHNFRHPDRAIDLKAIQAIVGLDLDRFESIFLERQYGDISLRFVQGAFDILDLDEPKIRELLRLTRIDPRPNAVIGMSPLDLMVKVVMGRKAVTIGAKALAAKERAYLDDLATLAEVETLAREVYPSPEAQAYYLSFVEDSKKIQSSKAKVLPLGTLLKGVELGVGDSTFINSQIDLTRYDDEQKKWLKDYAAAVLAAKAAKSTPTQH